MSCITNSKEIFTVKKYILYAMMAFGAIAMVSDSGIAQRIVPIADGADFVTIIKADSTLRRNSAAVTIYQLARNGYYLATGTLTNTDYHLFIRAAAGSGPKPIIRPAVNLSTGTSSRVFAPSSDFTLRGIYLANKDNAANPLTITNGIRPGKRGIRIVIDSCHIEFDVQSLVRLDVDSISTFLTNNIFSNLGNLNGNNGRVLDTRGNMQDTIWMVNNIIYNNAEKVLRTDNCRVNYLRVDHNTMVNCADGRIDLGSVVKGQFTNNLMVNCGFQGRDKNSPTGAHITAAAAKVGYSQYILVKNNNYYLDPVLESALPKDSSAVYPLAPYSKRFLFDTTLTRIVTEGKSAFGNDSAAVVLTKAPRLPKQELLTLLNATIVAPNKMEVDMGTGVSIEFEPHYVFDFTYQTSSPLYTRGVGGKPIGALLDWKTFGGPLGVDNASESGIVPMTCALSQNYPNPFNPSTRIAYQLPDAGLVTIKVFDILGREIATLVSEYQQSGSYATTWNATGIGSGVYLCRMQVGSVTLTKKMALMK